MTNHPMQLVIEELEATRHRLKDLSEAMYRQRPDGAHPTPEEKAAEKVLWQARDAVFLIQTNAELSVER